MEIGPDPRSGARTIKDSPLYPTARDRLYGVQTPKQMLPSPILLNSQPGPSHPPKPRSSSELMDLNLCSSPTPHGPHHPIAYSSNKTRASTYFSQDIIEISDDDEPGIRPIVVFAWVKVSFHHYILFKVQD